MIGFPPATNNEQITGNKYYTRTHSISPAVQIPYTGYCLSYRYDELGNIVVFTFMTQVLQTG